MQADIGVDTSAGRSIRVELFIDSVSRGSATISNGSVTFNAVSLDEGSRTIRVQCTDEGTVSAATRELVVDTEAPSVVITEPVAGTCYGVDDDVLDEVDGLQLSVRARIEAIDVVFIEARLDSNAPMDAPYGQLDDPEMTSQLYVELPSGVLTPNTVNVEVVDEHGNTGSASVEICLEP